MMQLNLFNMGTKGAIESVHINVRALFHKGQSQLLLVYFFVFPLTVEKVFTDPQDSLMHSSYSYPQPELALSS